MLNTEHRKAFWVLPFWFLLFLFLTTLPFHGEALSNENVAEEVRPVVEKHQRRKLTETEYGSVSAVDIRDGYRPPYHLQFFTLDPNSLFLPVLLHADMVFYVQTGSGKLFLAEEDATNSINLRPGEIMRLRAGSVFYLQSNLETERQKLRILAIFPSTDDNNYDPSIGAYSRINKLVRGFDKRIMQAALQAPEELIEAITNKTDTPAIVHAVSKEQTNFWELEVWFLNSILGREVGKSSNRKKLQSYNIFGNDPDFENCHGWSLTVTNKQLKSLKPTNIGLLMVNLTAGSMMGPHWNPRATEIAMVLQGEGMVRVVCGSSYIDESKCQDMRFKVKAGDIFVVPRFHPMAQMSFNNDSLVFLGFSTTVKKTYPQFLAGKRSVFHTIDKQILATSFNVNDTTIEQLLNSQADSIILGCLSCAEEEEKIMIEQTKRREEEARRREEEKRRREEEEARRREEEKRREEEEEARRREEEKRREEEARRREEEKKRKEEEEARQREEEKRREEEEEAARREEEERRKEEEERREEAAAAEREQEEARKEQERREKQKEKEEEEEAKRRERGEEEQEQARRQQEGRERRREEEEELEREREQARRQEEKRKRERERERREEEIEREQREARRQQEERERRREKEKEGEREQEQATRQHKERKRRGEEEDVEWEQEEARRQQEEMERRREEDEEVEQEQEQARRHKKERERRQGEEEGVEQEQARRQEEDETEIEALKQINGRSFGRMKILKIKKLE